MKAILESTPVVLEKHEYSNNRALSLRAVCADDGWPFCTLSVNIIDPEVSLQSKDLPPDHCYFKTWSENKGLLESLESQGAVKRTGVYHSATGAAIVKVLF